MLGVDVAHAIDVLLALGIVCLAALAAMAWPGPLFASLQSELA